MLFVGIWGPLLFSDDDQIEFIAMFDKHNPDLNINWESRTTGAPLSSRPSQSTYFIWLGLHKIGFLLFN